MVEGSRRGLQRDPIVQSKVRSEVLPREKVMANLKARVKQGMCVLSRDRAVIGQIVKVEMAIL